MARPPLADGFPEPTREQWLARAREALKGADPESLAARTVEGLLIEPLDGPGPPTALRACVAREPNAESPWDIRAIVSPNDPAETNAQVLEALAGGATSVLLEQPAPDDLARALDGLVFEAAPVALDAGFAGPAAAKRLGVLAKASPAARLVFHLDPFSAFARAGRSPGPIEAHVEAAAAVAADLVREYPAASLFLASGVVAHEAGASAAQELGVMAAAALAYAKALTTAGLSMDAAFAGIALGLAADSDVFVSLAKLRAAREIWGRMAAACGVSRPARIEARVSRRMLTRLDIHTNLIRQTAAAFAAAAGGADALAIDAFTQPIGAPDALGRRLARNIQLILAEESGLGRVGDPAAGSWHVENLTDQLVRASWSFFQDIEKAGRLSAALTSGLIAAKAAEVQAEREAEVHAGTARILGVTLHRDTPSDSAGAAPAYLAPAQPETHLPGPDSLCPPLFPRRLAESFEDAA